jgi:hypothetical protein
LSQHKIMMYEHCKHKIVMALLKNKKKNVIEIIRHYS